MAPFPNPDQIVAEARTWIDTRWVHQGRSRNGVDCAGLVVLVGQALGLKAEDMLGYKRSPDGVLFRKHIFDQTAYAPEPAPGLIGMFKETRFPTHCGIFAERDGQLTLIHAHAPYGKVVEEPFIFEWPKQLVAVRSYIGLAD